FYPGVFTYLGKIAREMDYELVMVTNQDGLGTDAFPETDFWPIQNFILDSLANEGISFEAIHMDRTFPEEGADTRKPGVGLLQDYFSKAYDLENSYVIGDRLTDMELALNLGASGIFINSAAALGEAEIKSDATKIKEKIALTTDSWEEVYAYLRTKDRIAEIKRKTAETDVFIRINPDGKGRSSISTGIAFFDHLLEQLSKHGHLDLEIQVKGDLEVDEHHTIEDTAIALGEALNEAIGNKIGMERYGFTLPMDDCLAQVAIDFGGRSWLVWEADFHREMIGQMPTEMFMHFFKSLSDGARANISIKAEGKNEHHKIEAIFKALAKSIKMAVKKDTDKLFLPSTKGTL
ncbi:MAG: bifunctional histidinol-phosphatase/imidazoleglycerol-phosphate dehydratase HisB, partial [Bacteroidia bacterium]|nr:bifunctional histidinol-phosphatase/imidazoleglycerol-phosphate dehydratase HisB [Bacteroidia bacterium]